MLSTKILGGGIALLVLGLIVCGLQITGQIPDQIYFKAGTAIVILGVITMGAGIFLLTGIEFMPKEGLRESDQNIFSISLLRSMLAISIADDVLDDSEIVELKKIYKHLTQDEMDTDTIRHTAEDMMASGNNIEEELAIAAKVLDKKHKEKIIIASLYILAADGDMDERELLILNDIRRGLKLSIEHVEKIKADFLSKRDLREVESKISKSSLKAS